VLGGSIRLEVRREEKEREEEEVSRGPDIVIMLWFFG
jgi:hypothetical protein